MDGNIFDSPALPLLLELEHCGFRMRLTDEGRIHVEPGSRLTVDHRQRLVAYKSTIVMLLRCCDAGVEARRDAFQVQLAATKSPALPAFLLRPDVPYVRGRCFSCGDVLERAEYGRCWRCALGWRLACRQPIPVDVALHMDRARQVA